MTTRSFMDSFVQGALESALANTPLAMGALPDERLESLILFCIEHKVEPILSASYPIMKTIDTLNTAIYATQIKWFRSNIGRFARVPSFTLIQGFARNNDFAPFMPPGRRSDIDFCVSDEDDALVKQLFAELGLTQTAIVNGEIVELDSDSVKELEVSIGYAYPKEIPYTLQLPFEVPELGDFEIGDAFGALRNIDGKIVLLLMMERTVSFADTDHSIFINPKNRVLNNGIYESDDHLFALTAALRLVKGTLNSEPRFRAGLELVSTIANPKFGFNASQFMKLATELELEETVSSAFHFLSAKSPRVKAFIEGIGLPVTANEDLERAFSTQLAARELVE